MDLAMGGQSARVSGSGVFLKHLKTSYVTGTTHAGILFCELLLSSDSVMRWPDDDDSTILADEQMLSRMRSSNNQPPQDTHHPST